MNPVDSKKLEEIKKAVELNYCFTAENWAGKQIRDPQEDERWLVFKLKEQDREIERITGLYNKARDEISRAERYRFVAEQKEKKAETALADFKKVYTAHATEAEKQIDELQEQREKLIAALRLIMAWYDDNTEILFSQTIEIFEAGRTALEVVEQDRGTRRLQKERKPDCVGWFWRKQTEKAEAELVQLREELKLRIHQRNSHSNQSRDLIEQQKKLEAKVKELEELFGEETFAERAAVRHYKRIKELEEELSWAADACEKAETALIDAKKVYEAHASEAERQIDELQEQREKLIGTLDKIVKYYDQMPKSHGYFYAEDIARAALANMKEKI